MKTFLVAAAGFEPACSCFRSRLDKPDSYKRRNLVAEVGFGPTYFWFQTRRDKPDSSTPLCFNVFRCQRTLRRLEQLFSAELGVAYGT